MARPQKVPAGGKKTVLLREDQIRLLEELARSTGRELSDLVRVAVDWVFPATNWGERARDQAALELCRRRLIQSPALARAARDGWSGSEMRLPLGERTKPADVRLVRQAVELLRRLGVRSPGGPGDPATDPGKSGTGEADEGLLPIPPGWATGAPDRLLTVLASPATQAVMLEGYPEPRPYMFSASPRICPPRYYWVTQEGLSPPPEPQYAAVAEALAELCRRKEVGDYFILDEPQPSIPTIGLNYHINWERLEHPAPPA
jgi:hypothetical protein